MREGLLSDYFKGLAVKSLARVELGKQHEFQGVEALQAFLGPFMPRRKFPATFVWVTDQEPPIRTEVTLTTWYNSREKKAHRTPEPRLYYPKEAELAVANAREGDTIFVMMRSDDSLLVVLCPKDSVVEHQLLWLGGLHSPSAEASAVRVLPANAPKLGFAARWILDLIGVSAEPEENTFSDELVARFGLEFPKTHVFSAYARSTVKGIDPVGDPDGALMKWIEREYVLFAALERQIISRRIEEGFGAGSRIDVKGFLEFSKSVGQRRMSRAGKALEHHFAHLLRLHGLRFSQNAKTEGKRTPDFLFPGKTEYHDKIFRTELLTLLGAKSTCKDRWRQVLSEGRRVQNKHLLTLEPGISVAQTEEMKASRLQLVVPKGLHETYLATQQDWLLPVSAFLDLVAERQRSLNAH